MIKPNLNFHNEYDSLIDKSNRKKALTLIKKISESKPGLLQESKFKIEDLIDGDLEIGFYNTKVFDYQTKRIIFNFFNSMNKRFGK